MLFISCLIACGNTATIDYRVDGSKEYFDKKSEANEGHQPKDHEEFSEISIQDNLLVSRLVSVCIIIANEGERTADNQ